MTPPAQVRHRRTASSYPTLAYPYHYPQAFKGWKGWITLSCSSPPITHHHHLLSDHILELFANLLSKAGTRGQLEGWYIK